MILVPHVVLQSCSVFVILVLLIFLSKKRPGANAIFPLYVTNELKGLAILLVYFSHIGNFLVSDHRFLAPISGLSQVGVDIFLILSGFGLSVSNLKRPQKPLDFYKRLLRLFIPLWILLSLLLIADAFFLQRHYSGHLIVLDYLGIFLTSILSKDINAPLWFITFITFYYLMFPLVFRKTRLWLSALILFALGAAIVAINPPVLAKVMFLYKLHYMAFPAGMVMAWWLFGPKKRTPHFKLPANSRYILALLSVIALILINPHSHQSDPAIIRQLANITFAALVILIFNFKRMEFKLLSLLGVYSFEIYLLHWPIVSRYNLLFGHIPTWLATLVYLAIIGVLAYLLQRLTDYLIPKFGFGLR